MILLPTNINADDLHQWLGGGICVVRYDGAWHPAQYERAMTVEEESRAVLTARARFVANGDPVITAVNDLAGAWPLCGSINLPDFRMAVHVERVPARQFRRTYNSRQVRVIVPRRWDVSKRLTNRQMQELGPQGKQVVLSLFNPVYPSVDEAFARLDDGWLSVALNSRVIVCADESGKRMVYYRGKLAAVTAGGKLDALADLTTCRLIDRALAGRLEWISTPQ